jgi:serine/threonine protein kinase
MLGKHEVIRQIAVGGMAELYLTRTVGIEGFEKLVCVKRILPQYVNNPSFVNMFLNEARLAATLHHPNIAQVYDIGQELGEFFFSMEYVHGEDLGRLVTAGRENGVPLSLDCTLTIAAGLCAGLHYAHEKAAPDGRSLGVVHRDVSPTNVLVSYDGAVKLVDFGIARAGEPSSSSQTGLKGKISYMSPEQCRGRTTLDRRSDVFSIGTILYELTTGRLPFIDETEYGVLHQIVNRDADPPRTLVPDYPPALEAIVMRALARDPEHRWPSALELQHKLEDFAHDTRLRVSPLVLARLMSTLFPARLEEWDHARAQGAFFVEQHVVRTLIESGKAADDESPAGDPGGASPGSRPPSAGGRPGSRPSQPVMESEWTSSPTVASSSSGTQPGIGPQGAPSRPSQISYAPGAVPITLPPGAPPIPSGGTLVSSATQAGTLPPVVKPGGLDGFAGQHGHGGQVSFAAQGGYAGPVDGSGVPAMPPGIGDVTDRVRIAAARPTLKINVSRRSRWPLVALAVVGAAGAAVAVWAVTARQEASMAPATTERLTAEPAPTPARGDDTKLAAKPPGAPSTAPAGEPAPAGEAAPAVEAAKVTAPPTEAVTAAAPAAVAPAVEAGKPPADQVAAPAGEPVTAAALPVAPPTEAKPGKRDLTSAPQEARTKTAKKARPESKRANKRPDAKRASKAGTKEQPWNDDSPFMPVVTPKR